MEVTPTSRSLAIKRVALTRALAPIGALMLAGLVCAAVLSPAGPEAKKKGKKKQKRPNIVLVMTDDQTVESMRAMPIVQSRLADKGVTFDNNLASFPLCCPSRATYLTGQYPDNHGVRTNQAPGGGFSKLDHGNTLPVWLQSSGYVTAHIGKYLNGYGNTTLDTDVPPGWTEWFGALDDPDAYTGGTYTMYGYTLNENGAVVHYGTTPDVVDPALYQTDVYSAKAQDFIRRRAPSRTPFFLSVAPLAPHGEGQIVCACTGNNPRAAPRHEGAFSSQAAPRTPSFNEADISDKPANIRNRASMGAVEIAAADTRYRARLESLLAVDEMVGALVDTVNAQGELKNTVFVFTSDNGFFHGEHRVRTGKVLHYTESSEVPLIIRGPEVPKGKHRSQLAANIDLAPTILDFANGRSKRNMDGRTLLPVIEDKRFEPGRAILIEGFNNADPSDPEGADVSYSAVRTDRFVYAETGAEQELYDLSTDPFEIQSRHNDPALSGVKVALDTLLARLTACAGKNSCGARPALKLRLGFQSGGGCVASGIGARIKGRDDGQVVQARFYANGRKAKKSIGAGQLSGSHKNRISATAVMLDGREVTVEKSAPEAC
jgi:arylsulfatase A-like enzyme